MTNALGACICFVLLVCGCGEPEPPAPPAAPSSAEFDAEALARAYLEAHPRATIATLGGDHEAKVMPFEGELEAPILRQVFPNHRFFEFRVSIFSGRRNPKAYVVVSKTGATREILMFRDFGVDPATVAFFKEHVRVAFIEGQVHFDRGVGHRAMGVVDACVALRGDGPTWDWDHTLEEHLVHHTLIVRGGRFRIAFDAWGRLTDLKMK